MITVQMLEDYVARMERALTDQDAWQAEAFRPDCFGYLYHWREDQTGRIRLCRDLITRLEAERALTSDVSS